MADQSVAALDEDELVAAWAEVALPSRSALTEHECDECDEIREFFGGRPWTDFPDTAALRYHSDALYLFSPCAYHYYLPAFMRATLVEPQAADLIPDRIFYTMRLELGNASRGRLELFSPKQRKLVATFLRDNIPSVAVDAVEAEEIATLAAILDEER